MDSDPLIYLDSDHVIRPFTGISFARRKVKSHFLALSIYICVEFIKGHFALWINRNLALVVVKLRLQQTLGADEDGVFEKYLETPLLSVIIALERKRFLTCRAFFAFSSIFLILEFPLLLARLSPHS